jgi:hypothetical protein
MGTAAGIITEGLGMEGRMGTAALTGTAARIMEGMEALTGAGGRMAQGLAALAGSAQGRAITAGLALTTTGAAAA